MMKRALTAAVVGGLMTFFVPQAAFADHNAEHRGDCGAKTEKADSDQQAPKQQRQGDHEQEHSDGGEILF